MAMEVLGTVAAVTSLVKATKTTCGWLSAFRNAPRCVRELQAHVDGFDIVFKGVQRALCDETIAQNIPREQVDVILGNAKDTLTRLKSTLAKVQREIGTDVSRMRWLLNESKCQSFQDQLTRYGDSLNRILNVANSDRLRLIEHVNVLLRMRDPLLLQFNAETMEAMDGDTQIVIREEYSAIHDTQSSGPSLSPGNISESKMDEQPLTKSHSIEYTTESCFEQSCKYDCSKMDQQTLTKSHPIENTTEPRFEQSCKDDCSCTCHTASTYLPSGLSPKRGGSPLRFVTQYVRRCSIRECRGRKLWPSGTFILPSKVVKKAVGVSLIERGYHTLIHLKCARIVPEGCESIRYAATGNLEGLRRLLDNGTATVCERSPNNWSLLHNAAYYGTVEQVVLLIKRGADIEAGEIGTRKPAHLAMVRALDADATKLDRERAEAFPNWKDYKDDFEFTPIHIAVLDIYERNDKDRPDLLELLKFVEDANNAHARQKWSTWKEKYHQRSALFGQIIEAFRQAASRLHSQRLLEKPYLNLIDEPDTRQKWTPFHWATYTGRLDKMKILLSRVANPFLITGMGRNALHQAAESKRVEVMNYIFDIPEHPTQGWFDINLQDQWGETPLHVAVYGKSAGSVKCVELLLQKGARRDLRRVEDYAVPLHLVSLAKEDVRTIIVDLLSADSGPHINALDNRGRSPIFGVLSNPECVAMLLERGADISIRDDAGMSVLHYACVEDEADTLRILLEWAEAGLATSPDHKGDIPLAKALEFKSGACARVLLESGAIGDVDGKDGLTLVHRAVKMGDADFLEACFQYPTFEKGMRTPDGLNVIELAGRVSTFDGRVKELILEYESYGRSGAKKKAPDYQNDAELTR